MLIVICFITAMTLLISSYYVINYGGKKYVLVTCWDATDVIDSIIRLCQMGHISDQMQHAVRP